MKQLFTLILLATITPGILLAQNPPEAFNYSAVARDANSNPIANSTLGIQISLRQGSPLGTVVYQENHFVNTDQFGLFNLTVGGGSIQSGSMASIDWSAADFYMQVGMDANGGTNFLTMGTTQLLSVPYALHAKTAESIIGGSQVTITGTGSTTVTGTAPNFTVNSTDMQNISLVGDVLSIQNGNSITLPLNLNSYGYSVMFNNVPISDPAINDVMIEPNVFLSENNYVYKLMPEALVSEISAQKRYSAYLPAIDDISLYQIGDGTPAYYSNAGCTGTLYVVSQHLVGQVFATLSGISYVPDSAAPTSVTTNSYRDLLSGCTNQNQVISAYTALPNNPAITGVHFTNTNPVQVEIVR
jgi:hypothetical protein